MPKIPMHCARKKAPVSLLGVHLLPSNCTCSLVCPCSFASCLKLVLIPYCWLVALEKKKKKKKKKRRPGDEAMLKVLFLHNDPWPDL